MELTSKMIFDMAQNVAKNIHLGELQNMDKEDLVGVDCRCAWLNDDGDNGWDHTVDYFKSLVNFHIAAREAGYKVERDEMDRETIVRGIVNGVVERLTGVDPIEIKDVLLDDYGQCIYITTSDGVGANTIVAIGNEFGDDSPEIYGLSEGTIKIVIYNESHQELIL